MKYVSHNNQQTLNWVLWLPWMSLLTITKIWSIKWRHVQFTKVYYNGNENKWANKRAPNDQPINKYGFTSNPKMLFWKSHFSTHSFGISIHGGFITTLTFLQLPQNITNTLEWKSVCTCSGAQYHHGSISWVNSQDTGKHLLDMPL